MKNTIVKKGFTLLEVMISVGIFSFIMAAILTTMMQFRAFHDVGEAKALADLKAMRSMEGVAEKLWSSGFSVDDADVSYPYIESSGPISPDFVHTETMPAENSAIIFRMLDDVNNDGVYTSPETGAIEWSAAIYKFLLDADGTLALMRKDPGTDEFVREAVVCTDVKAITFEMNDTNPELKAGEIKISMWLEVVQKGGGRSDSFVTRVVKMRNEGSEVVGEKLAF